VGLIQVPEGTALKGRFRFRTYDAEAVPNERAWRKLRYSVRPEHRFALAEAEADNTLMLNGLSLLALGLVWALAQNQNASFGSPFSAAGSNLGNAYGAVGTSTSFPPGAVGAQTALQMEIGRALLSNAAVLQNQIILDFFFNTAAANGSIAEAGVFLQANLITTTLSQALASGQSYNNLQVTATPADIPAGSTITIGYGTTTTQQVTTVGDTPPNSTQINVTSFTANANYPAGGQTTVAYLPGTMLDRSIFATPVVKTNTQTAVLEVTLTLISA
jgi:hypothetical protein